MASRDEDIAWYRELLAPIGQVEARRMFGGVGLYADGAIIALEIEGVLYLKTDAQTRGRFAQAGGVPFVYEGARGAVTVAYWTPPEDAMDSAEAMRPWAMLAVQAAQRSAVAKSAKRTPAKRAGSKKAASKKTVSEKVSAGKNTAQKTADGKVRASAGRKAAADTIRDALSGRPRKR